METESKRPIIAIIIGVLVLLLFSIAVSYAYFTANFGGGETTTSIEVTGGTLDLIMNGGSKIIVSNVIPDNNPVATKSFTVTGDNNTAGMELEYEIYLVLDENTFTSNAISYKLTGINTSVNGAQALDVTEHQHLLTGIGEYLLGRGYFDPGMGVIHTYDLSVFFLDTGIPQNENQNKDFKAHVELRNVR